MEIVDMMPG